MVKGKLIQFRKGRHTVTERQYLLEISDSNSNLEDRESAEKYVGSEVQWKSPSGKIIKGQISSPHGNSGVVRARFEKGLPGQAIGTEVEISQNKSDNKKTENKNAKEEKK